MYGSAYCQLHSEWEGKLVYIYIVDTCFNIIIPQVPIQISINWEWTVMNGLEWGPTQYLFIGLVDDALVNLFNATCIPRFDNYVTACSSIFGDEVNNVAYIYT